MRNVGFVKVEQEDESTVVHIHGKGLRLTEDKTLKLYIVYAKKKECIGIWQGDIEHVNPSVNYRLMYTPEDTKGMENYSRIDGIVMENAGKRRFAAMWSDMSVNLEEMRIWQEAADTWGAEEIQAVEETVEIRDENPVEMIPEVLAEPASENSCMEEPCQTEDLSEKEAPAAEKKEEFPQYTKIQRQDLARLPRCEWRLANNSFLMHAYSNYHHLLFIRQKNGCWLGVPGVYHGREAKAAEAFGFPQFIRVDQEALELTEEERNAEDDFGYWCRKIKLGTGYF